jgi:hypothetical protein
MFDKYSSMARGAWNKDGEQQLARYFSKSYVDQVYYNSWYCTLSGYPGCLPQNQSEERTNLEMKGAKVLMDL